MGRSWGQFFTQNGDGDESPEEESGFFRRLRDSLSKSRRALTDQFTGFDPTGDEAWERLEEALIAADVGVPATAELVRRLEARGGLDGLSAALSEGVAALLGPPPLLHGQGRPSGIPVARGDGAGETTPIG